MKDDLSEILPAIVTTLFFIVFFLPFFYLWIPYKIVSSPETLLRFDVGAFRYFGLVPIAAGGIVYLWCSNLFVVVGKGAPIPFTPTQALIVSGLYRFVRNPMYLAGVFILAGEALLTQSLGILIYAFLMAGLFHFHILMEESWLDQNFGTRYRRYRSRVPRWVPRLTPYRGDDAQKR